MEQGMHFSMREMAVFDFLQVRLPIFKVSDFRMDTPFDHNSLPLYLRTYYKSIFPYKQYLKWMTYGLSEFFVSFKFVS